MPDGLGQIICLVPGGPSPLVVSAHYIEKSRDWIYYPAPEVPLKGDTNLFDINIQ